MKEKYNNATHTHTHQDKDNDKIYRIYNGCNAAKIQRASEQE